MGPSSVEIQWPVQTETPRLTSQLAFHPTRSIREGVFRPDREWLGPSGHPTESSHLAPVGSCPQCERAPRYLSRRKAPRFDCRARVVAESGVMVVMRLLVNSLPFLLRAVALPGRPSLFGIEAGGGAFEGAHAMSSLSEPPFKAPVW